MSLKKYLAFIALIGLAQFMAHAQAIFDDQFEDEFVVNETLLNVELQPSTTEATSDGMIAVSATGSSASDVVIRNLVDPSERLRYSIEIAGGDARIELPDLERDPSLEGEAKTANGSYVLNSTWFRLVNYFAKVKKGLDKINYGRLTGTSLYHDESLAQGEKIDVVIARLPSVELRSACALTDTACYLGKQPVLLVHGYQPEPKLPRLENNGGNKYWQHFPARLMALSDDVDSDYVVFEFAWVSNANFEDVAVDLLAAINLIRQRTRHQVHIVAHFVWWCFGENDVTDIEPK